MTAPAPSSPDALARRVRERFVEDIDNSLARLAEAIGDRLQEQVDKAPSSREAHQRRDARVHFEARRSRWVEKTRRALRRASQPAAEPEPAPKAFSLELQLIGDDVVERKIIASRLAMAIHEKATWELADLKLRMQVLEGIDDFANADLLRPEALSLLLIEQWMDSELSRQTWLQVSDLVQQMLVPVTVNAYSRANTELVRAGVVPDIDAARRVKRGASPAARPVAEPALTLADGPSAGSSASPGMPRGDVASAAVASLQGASPLAGMHGQAPMSLGTHAVHAGQVPYAAHPGHAPHPAHAGHAPHAAHAGHAPHAAHAGHAPHAANASHGSFMPATAQVSAAPFAASPDGAPAAPSLPASSAARPFAGLGWEVVPSAASGFGALGTGGGAVVAAHPAAAPVAMGFAPGQAASWPAGGVQAAGTLGDAGPPGLAAADRGASTAASSLQRARARAQNLVGQLRQLLVDRVAGFDPGQMSAPSSALAQALTVQQTHIRTLVEARESANSPGLVVDQAAVQQVARELRERSGELKQQASRAGEKAVIEIVALMFQSILAEERIPPAVRVWFARLQMPVLRIALSEPEFFGSLQHPARQLIDRMGSCVLGFDAGTIDGRALEAEIRRVVQTIEQYPETGRKVFQLAVEEFQKFLARFLTGRGRTQRLVTVAQQIEQKETMAVRYTIELRKMLEGMPVREEIRSFLFKVWAEVMAVAAVKNGSQHADTLALRKSASELVWAASAKPNRAERAQVIQGLPALLQRLRQGMGLLGLDAAEQEAHIKVIGDTFADAFQSKTAAIPAASIEAIARRLADLEDTLGEEPEGDLPLVAESIELMLGMDSSGIEVITDGGSTPGAAMLAWARELQPGTWFSLDHNGRMHQVQYVWRSEHGQLHLFVSEAGPSFLVQLGRLAAYLQAGLVLPAEEEALTVRATREALAKLDANPERLFA
ncbi:DUF1631 family protein [Ramlibacter rhizophilus]|uniref:DUF1631 domain-containing protein n=1 Tax=Ramlibacter rhizophilus TaxID=1781167 RepID=A0A4Z0BGG9_9BURK|nr:DUF1631 family protein [Ramlibacter rhizophilus]TFY97870.1 DUF1631 domain-containing protein [Ramlibacter rhizophilus]